MASSVMRPTADHMVGMQVFNQATPTQLHPNASAQELEVVISAVYRQVLGNAYVMESERLTVAESQLCHGESSVREFVRQVALSSLYRDRFVVNCSRSRSIELNFKHLLGRAPDSLAEIRDHSRILDRKGYEADIDSYLDSDEYQTHFGEWIVPYYRGYQTQPNQSMLGFTNLFQLVPSASSSDKDLTTNQRPRLTRSLLSQFTPASDPAALIQAAMQPTPAPTPASTPVAAVVPADVQEIEALKQQLADLQRSASIGAAITKSLQFNGASDDLGTDDTLPLAQQKDRLQQQIAQARALAAVGEARLNRWRSRSF